MSDALFPDVRISGRLLRSERMRALPSNSARYGWIAALTVAAWMRPSGQFYNAKVLRGANWHHRSFIKPWLAVGLLERGDAMCPDCQEHFPGATAETLVVHRWRDYRVASRREAIKPEHRIAIAAAFAGRCAYCGRSDQKMHIDHRLPVARGGRSDLDNLVLACSDCNLAKHDDDPALWPVRFGPGA